MTKRRNWSLRLGFAVAALAAAWSLDVNAFSLDGQNATVTLQETGFDDVSEVVSVGAGNEIVGNTGSEIGAILFSDEYVDLSGLQIVYRIQGGGGSYGGAAPECSGSPGCSLWGQDPDDARFLFSNLNFGVPGAFLNNVTLLSSSVFGATISDITADSFVLNFGSAGILNGTGGSPALGTLTMNLNVQAVPLPGTLPLLLTASIGFLGISRRRKANKDATS